MLDFLALFLPLLVPVAALLFLNLRLSRRLRYPHYFLAEERRRGPASFLFRSLRAHYDIFIDALIALVLAFALLDARPTGLSVGSAPGDRARERSALVIDCSRSMLAGIPGSRPLDLALKLREAEEQFRGMKSFALAFDPISMKTRLYDLLPLLKERTGETAAAVLSGELSFFSVDYGALAQLRKQGFRDITLLTDRLPGRPEGFRAIELGFAGGQKGAEIAGGEAFGAYPSGARYDRLADSYLVSFALTGAGAPFEIGIWSADAGGFDRLPASRFRVEDTAGGRRLRLPGPGLYLVSFKGPYGQAGADFPIRIEPGKISAGASGSFSELLLKAFPLLEQAPRPRIFLADLGAVVERGSVEEGQSSAGRLVSSIVELEGELMLDPLLSGGRSIAAALVPGADFGLCPSSLANEDLILAYDGAILSRQSSPFASSVPQGTRRLLPAGSSFLAFGAEGLVPLIPPPSEFFEESPIGALRIPPPTANRLLWTALLGLLALAKLLLWHKLSGKPYLRSV